jgi:hypothetical protein
LGRSVSISSAVAEPALGKDGFLLQAEKTEKMSIKLNPKTANFFIKHLLFVIRNFFLKGSFVNDYTIRPSASKRAGYPQNRRKKRPTGGTDGTGSPQPGGCGRPKRRPNRDVILIITLILEMFTAVKILVFVI